MDHSPISGVRAAFYRAFRPAIQPGDGRMTFVPTWLGLLALGLIAFLPTYLRYYRPVGYGLDVIGYPIGRDFINSWMGPQLAFSGRVDMLFDVDAYVAAISQAFGQPLPFHTFSYPPSLLPFLWPLGLLPYGWSYALFCFAGFAALAAAALPLFPPHGRTRALLWLALSPATLVTLVGGQNGCFTGALMLGGLVLLPIRPILAGVLFGLLTVKPQLGLILPLALLAIGAWRTIAAAALTALALLLGSAALFGPDTWLRFLQETNGHSWSMLQAFNGFFIYMTPSVYAGGRLFGLSADAANLLQAAVALPVLSAAVLALRRTEDRFGRAFVIVSAAPLLTPYVFNYDLTALSAVLACRLDGLDSQRERPILAAAWLLPAICMPMAMHGLGLAPLMNLAAFAVALRAAWSPADPQDRLAAAIVPGDGDPRSLAGARRSP